MNFKLLNHSTSVNIKIHNFSNVMTFKASKQFYLRLTKIVLMFKFIVRFFIIGY